MFKRYFSVPLRKGLFFNILVLIIDLVYWGVFLVRLMWVLLFHWLLLLVLSWLLIFLGHIEGFWHLDFRWLLFDRLLNRLLKGLDRRTYMRCLTTIVGPKPINQQIQVSIAILELALKAVLNDIALDVIRQVHKFPF
jgi:hypothetical protein